MIDINKIKNGINIDGMYPYIIETKESNEKLINVISSKDFYEVLKKAFEK